VTVPTPAGLTVEVLRTADVPGPVLDRVRTIMTAAFEGRFDEHDWAHALGGTHVIASIDGVVLAHAAVVPRALDVDGVALRTGYVEAVATAPSHQGLGIGTAVMTAASELVRSAYDLGALSTGRPSFYERLGWERWAGTTWVRTVGGLVRTPEEDDGILVLRTPTTGGLSLTGAITCEARPGDDW
jgi:aminoglycoside 2'-N-acetyltransferase I